MLFEHGWTRFDGRGFHLFPLGIDSLADRSTLIHSCPHSPGSGAAAGVIQPLSGERRGSGRVNFVPASPEREIQ